MLRQANSAILLFCLIFISCNPFISKELRQKKRCIRKIDKIQAVCPSAVLRDTIVDTVEVIIPEIRVDTFFAVNSDVSGVDSIVDKFQGEIDSLTAIKLKTELRWYVKERPCLLDTIRIDSFGIHIEIYQIGDKIYHSLFKEEQVIEKEVEVVVDRIVKPKLTVWEQFILWASGVWRWLVFLIILLVIIYIFRKGFKSYLPWL